MRLKCITAGAIGTLALALGAPADGQEATDEQPTKPVPNKITAPVSDPAVDSVWEYLRAKYDADKDGAIAKAEYDRDDERFTRLDRNDDGSLTEADFVRGGRGGRAGMDSEMRQRMRSQVLITKYFQHDDDSRELSRDELKQAAAAYDTSGDGRIDIAEFTCAYEARENEVTRQQARMLERLMGTDTVWEALVDGVDGDDDELISIDELDGFFVSRDDGDGVWTAGGRGARRPRGQRNRRDGARGGGGNDGPTVGTTAPDFTLQPPDGGRKVTLSEFAAKNKPVALIFGSYT